MPIYIVRKNPHDKKWYVLGSIKTSKKTYFMPISQGYDTRVQAQVHKDRQPYADEAAKKCLTNI